MPGYNKQTPKPREPFSDVSSPFKLFSDNSLPFKRPQQSPMDSVFKSYRPNPLIQRHDANSGSSGKSFGFDQAWDMTSSQAFESFQTPQKKPKGRNKENAPFQSCRKITCERKRETKASTKVLYAWQDELPTCSISGPFTPVPVQYVLMVQLAEVPNMNFRTQHKRSKQKLDMDLNPEVSGQALTEFQTEGSTNQQRVKTNDKSDESSVREFSVGTHDANSSSINVDTPIELRNSIATFERIELYGELMSYNRRPNGTNRMTQAQIGQCIDSYVAARDEGNGWNPAVRERIGESLGITQTKVYKTLRDQIEYQHVEQWH